MNIILILIHVLLTGDVKTNDRLQFSDAHAISGVGERSRAPIHTDAIEHLIVLNELTPPTNGEAVETPNGERTWTAVEFDEEGVLESPKLNGGYVHAMVNAPASGPMILRAKGHSLVYVNGAPKAGDPYARGTMPLPVMLNEGPNSFVFRVGRGRLQAQLEKIPTRSDQSAQPLGFTRLDDTLPDVVVNVPIDVLASVVVANYTNEWTGPSAIVATGPNGEETVNEIPRIAPLSVRKVPIQLIANAQKELGNLEFQISLIDSYKEHSIDERILTLKIVDPAATRRVTFRSGIDHSVQFYGLTPAKNISGSTSRPGIILSLHGAGVDAKRQAGCYEPKEFAHVVAPTNRRAYGFDWEDWGRLDALEALDHAQKTLATDPEKQWLTGHSMGGHGTWQLGVHHSDTFAAIAPSAGWESFSSYGGARIARDTPAGELLAATAAPSETLLFTDNLKDIGVYILHGDADDNVPVTEARTMRDALSKHSDLVYFEQKGAGHWWGNECVDWPPLIEFLKDHESIDSNSNFVTLTTANPSINGRKGWVELTNQITPLEVSNVTGLKNPESGRIDLSTENVSRIRLFLEDPSIPWSIYADGEFVSERPGRRIAIQRGAIVLERKGTRWRETNGFTPHHKQPNRGGRFKSAFNNDMVFVIGTSGNAEENKANLDIATFDAETFLYRGNGSPECIRDVDFDSEQYPLRNIILYGNADTNSAWNDLLKDSPVTVRRGKIALNDQEITGDDLAVLMIRPVTKNSTAAIGTVSGTGPAGMRLAAELPYFVSGVHYPDLIVIGSDTLIDGYPGIRRTGFFGNDWNLESGIFAGSE